MNAGVEKPRTSGRGAVTQPLDMAAHGDDAPAAKSLTVNVRVINVPVVALFAGFLLGIAVMLIVR